MSERFKTLAAHFFSRFFDKEALSPEADARANVVQIVAMLALPGAFLSLFMIADHPMIRSEVMRLWLRAGDRYVFICYAMVVMGFVMTFKWDSLFPDRRDYLVLTPLPIAMKEFFAAKVIALCAFLLMFVVAINLFSCLLVPYVYVVRHNSWSIFFPALVAHGTAVLSASIFTALLFGAFQGVLINVMTPDTFRRVSPWIQMISMIVLITVLLITPGISMNIRLLVENDTRLLDYIPLFWFLGVYETLNPDGTLIPVSNLWAATALEAIVVVGAVFAVTYLISYRRYSKKILEGIESQVFVQRWYRRATAALLNATLLRHSSQRASYHFIGRIFARSPKHRLFIAMYSGIGLAIITTSLFVLRQNGDFVLSVSKEGLVEAPLILAFFVVSGLRATFNIPYELNANWMFQITTGRDAAEYLKATRTWVLLRGIVPAFFLLAPLEFAVLDSYEAALHLGFGMAIALLLIECFFFSFNKVPFTCSYLPAKSHLAFLGGAYLYGFTLYSFTMAQIEIWISASEGRVAVFFGVVLLILSGISIYRSRTHDKRLAIVYEDDRDPLVRQLNLT